MTPKPTEPPCTDPYARWCDRESPRGPTYVDSCERTDPAARGFGEILRRPAAGGPPQDARDSRGDSQNNDSWGRWDCFATSLLAMTADSRATTRHEIHGEMALARPNAAAAATPPINAVWTALRNGRVPVKRPLTYPKTNRARSVKPMEYRRAVAGACTSM